MMEYLSINELMETKTQLQLSQKISLKHKMEKNKVKFFTDTEGLVTTSQQEVKTTREELTQRINS